MGAIELKQNTLIWPVQGFEVFVWGRGQDPHVGSEGQVLHSYLCVDVVLLHARGID